MSERRYLDESEQVRLFSEALSGEVHAVFLDNTSVVAGLSAASGVLSVLLWSLLEQLVWHAVNFKLLYLNARVQLGDKILITINESRHPHAELWQRQAASMVN
jgi:hypothetical protein